MVLDVAEVLWEFITFCREVNCNYDISLIVGPKLLYAEFYVNNGLAIVELWSVNDLFIYFTFATE